MSDQSQKNYSAITEDLSADDSQPSRRGFLKVGAAVAAGLLGACGDTPGPSDNHGEDGVGGGSTGRGGSGGKGNTAGSTNGGAGSSSTVGSAGSMGKGGSGNEAGAAGGEEEPSAGGSSKTGSGGGSTAGTTKTGGTKGGSTGTGGATQTKSDGGGITPKGDSGAGKAGGSVNAGGSTPVDPDASHTPSGGGASAEDHGGSCKVGTITSKANPKLPDPFTFLDGTRISKKEDWACLRAELSAALQAGIYGPKMPPPDSLKATYSGGSLSIDMTVGSNKKTVTVKVGSAGTASAKKPCLITCGGSSLGTISGIATANLDYNSWASESNLGGIVQSLFGNTCAKSGALIGWAWGCSRIIDALEQCPEAGIDLNAIAVTGCSRCGKGALAMGAFDERVALTLVQESGSGGVALWRVSSKEKSMGMNIQEATEIVGEAKWQGSDFKSYVNDVTKLPCDEHFAVALCAPRAIMMFENDIDWLGPVAVYGGAVAGAKVYEALGIKDRCGCVITANHTHCSFPSAEQKYLDAFTNRFLKGQTADTSGAWTFKASNTKLGSFKEADWIDWEVPTLSGNLAWDPFA